MGGGAAAATPNPNPNPKLSSLNPNWAQLHQKLKTGRPHKPSTPIDADAKTLTASLLGKRKDRLVSEPEASPPSSLTPTSSDIRCLLLLLIEMIVRGCPEASLVFFFDFFSYFLLSGRSLTNVLAMDCEMVGVNSWGNAVYDEYARPVERIVDFRTKISGIRPKNMKKAKEFWAVQKEVAELIKGRILVGHALHNDLKVLLLSHPKRDMRDTSDYEPFLREGRRRALKDLAAQILGVKIQQKEHCPVEDARAAMFIYNKYKKEWEKTIKKRFKSKEKLKNRRKKKSEAASKPDVSSGLS
ncbi:RNA exonuclease 4 [Cocos nucifera]|uniref:RNA exonuclease 4 n=1 Tax=Cocos nucifera TaxID=13894 RepID=A0A8K0N2P8_COCNU|nr:RNA exonuclease 4 [Cocos nucifera]